MRIILLFILSSLSGICAYAQSESVIINGEISYISSKNVYVKFKSTKAINPGDTLYIKAASEWLPILKIINKSSISCLTEPITKLKLKKGDKVVHLSKSEMIIPIEEYASDVEPELELKSKIKAPTENKGSKSKKSENEAVQYINGRISASGYTTFSSKSSMDDPRMKYTLSLKGDHLANSIFSIDSYLSFRHQLNHWDEISTDFNRAFKVYNLALQYQNNRFEVILGRKINKRVSNIGAVDGLQLAYKLNNFTFGGILGTRPDVYDYGFNPNLPEAGIYFEHLVQGQNGLMKNTLGLFEQRSGKFTDRRYLYFQHSNSLTKKLYFYGSFQLDLYKKINDQQQSDFKLTSLYLSARYRVSRKFNIFASYDTRQNVIYYETYKNAVDRLIEQETRQGFRLRFLLRPFKLASIGLSGTYRYQKDNLSPSKNLNVYFNYSRLPLLGIGTSLSYTYLNTYYLQSHIAGIRLRKDLWKGQLGVGSHYRYVVYNYNSNDLLLHHHITGINLNWRIIRDLSLSLNYELTINKADIYHRSYLKLIKRIR